MPVPQFETLRFVATNPVPEVLQFLCRHNRSTLADALAFFGGHDAVLEEEFRRRNFVMPPEDVISARGQTCFCCIEGIEGASIVELADALRQLDPAASRVSLVREGMTTRFVDFLSRLDPLRRLMICSPWVNLDKSRLRKLIASIELSERVRGFRPEVTVLTRPIDQQPGGAENPTLGYLKRIDSVITYDPRLHSKLYIVEAGTDAPQRYAFVGSENFTTVRYQELGIMVNNDQQLIDDLIRYFLSAAKL
jgi:hypothetical protein